MLVRLPLSSAVCKRYLLAEPVVGIGQIASNKPAGWMRRIGCAVPGAVAGSTTQACVECGK